MSPESDAAVRPRRALSSRQASTVAELLSAGLDELRSAGYEQLTVRSVAARAGVTHTTAYGYFSSKGHLVAEIYWQRIRAVPYPGAGSGYRLEDRVTQALDAPARILGDDPALAHAALSALLSADPEVSRLRNKIGLDLAERVGAALGPGAPAGLQECILLAFSGAMLQAGMGYFSFDDVIGQMRSLTSLIVASAHPATS